VHVREDGRDRADLAGWLGFPNRGIKIRDQNLVQEIVRGKDPNCGLGKLNVNLASAHSHNSTLLD
jgi:hypothetical protein